jgi:F-type H+-transporting ATPase subunit delta
MVDDSTRTHGPDIGRQRLGTIYATAFLDAMDKSGQTEAMMEELDALVRDVLDKHPELGTLLSSLRLSLDEKASLLDRVLGAHVSESLMSFLKVVNNHHRLDCLRDIHREVRKQFNDRRGVVDAHVTTAVPVQDDLAGRITEALQAVLGRQVQLVRAVNPEVIGGMLIRVGDKVFDGSVVNQLKRLREEVLKKTMQELQGASERFVAAE